MYLDGAQCGGQRRGGSAGGFLVLVQRDFLVCLGGQPADIAFCAAQVLEKARDRRNEGAIAQADIATYHDVVKWSTTCSGLLRRGIARNWVSACLRLHRCPKVVLKIGERLSPVK